MSSDKPSNDINNTNNEQNTSTSKINSKGMCCFLYIFLFSVLKIKRKKEKRKFCHQTFFSLAHFFRSSIRKNQYLEKDSFGVKVFETKVDPQPRVTKKAIACFVCRKFVF